MPAGMKFSCHSACIDHAVASRHENFHFDSYHAVWFATQLLAGQFDSQSSQDTPCAMLEGRMPAGMKFSCHSAQIDHAVSSRHENFHFDCYHAVWVATQLLAGQFAS